MNQLPTTHPTPKRGRRLTWRRALALGLVIGAYPAFVLVYTWGHVLASDLPGGRHGPLDAYRHALASSVVAYTLGDGAVELVTGLFESSGKASNTMDRHNNRIGTAIGARAAAFRELEPQVRQAVAAGAVGAKPEDQITWLPETAWGKAWFW